MPFANRPRREPAHLLRWAGAALAAGVGATLALVPLTAGVVGASPVVGANPPPVPPAGTASTPVGAVGTSGLGTSGPGGAVGAGRVTNAYLLVQSDGAVHGFGGAAALPGTSGRVAARRIVGGAATPGGGGYWLLSAVGTVVGYGDAGAFGEPAAARHQGRYVAMAATPDGGGYWAVSAGGTVVAEGDARFFGSATREHVGHSVVGVTPTPDGGGYWLTTRQGGVYPFGDARWLGTTSGPSRSPLVGLAPTADGGGYWLAYADGTVLAFGDAPAEPSTTAAPSSRVASIAGLANGRGYWLATATGTVAATGQAVSHGGLAGTGASSVVAVLATRAVGGPGSPAPTHLTGDPYRRGFVGYDVSNWQCAPRSPSLASSSLPTRAGFAVLQVAGWLDSSANGCLASELAWSARAARGGPQALYLFVNAPPSSPAAAAQDATGPAGRCVAVVAAARASCRAYNYGYNGATRAAAYARSQGATAPLWWLDVEGGRSSGAYGTLAGGAYWSVSPQLNDRTIQGALDALRAGGITVGLYSTSVQYARIAGSYVPSGPQVPLWVAGVTWTSPPYTEKGLPPASVLASWCAGTARYAGSPRTDGFAGGSIWLLQETPGSLPSPYGIDPDYAC